MAAAPGRLGAGADRVPGPPAALTVLKGSALPGRRPPGTGRRGDSAAPGRATRPPEGDSPRKKPQGPARPAEDRASHRARARRRGRAAQRRGRLRRGAARAARDRPQRAGHTRRVCAVAGRVNRQLAR